MQFKYILAWAMYYIGKSAPWFRERTLPATVDTSPAATRPKILLVEDNAANRDMLTRRLERCGFQVRSAVDGASGVASAETEMPDLILMDVALGEMDGWEATRRIKARASTSQIPIVALTAHALATDREKSVEVGCADFDTKPVDLARLLEKIRTCLRATGSRAVPPVPAADRK
jgi:two-component system, cell cycle response regulator DivK